MVLVAGGEFSMGDPRGAADETPHKVAVSAFFMDRHPVSQELYEKITGLNPSKRRSPKNPIERIQWTDAARFCNQCSEIESLTPCYDPDTWKCNFEADGYRLPTEAEWEYACRAGTSARYSFGDNAARLGEYAWFKRNSQNALHATGRKKPNRWGLHDMHGGVWEWCNDFYAKKYAASDRANPRGPDSGQRAVLRGGSWRNSAESARSAARYSETPGFSDVCFNADLYGFRCVRNVPPAQATPK